MPFLIILIIKQTYKSKIGSSPPSSELWATSQTIRSISHNNNNNNNKGATLKQQINHGSSSSSQIKNIHQCISEWHKHLMSNFRTHSFIIPRKYWWIIVNNFFFLFLYVLLKKHSFFLTIYKIIYHKYVNILMYALFVSVSECSCL